MTRSRGTPTRARAFAAGVAALLGLTLFPLAGIAQAQGARGTEDACPADAPDAFNDDDTNVHEDNINCIAAHDITQGITADQFGPRRTTKRDQMASFIARFIDTATGSDLPTNPPDAFTDDEQSVHEDNINRLAEGDVVSGTSATTFTPRADVERGQMATFIAQGIDFVDDGQVNGSLPPATNQDFFTDDEQSVHENNINRLAAQDIVAGTGGGNFSPDTAVFRDQMASFIAQAADFLAERGLFPAARAANVVLDAQTVQAGDQITGEVTGENVQSVTVSGCGLNNEPVNDTNANEAGIQFSEQIPSNQAGGDCTLTFTVTLTDGETITIERTITVTEAEGQATATTRPEIVEAEIVSTNTADQTGQDGTTVRFTFDEPVTGQSPVEGNFHVYEFNGTVHTAATAGTQPGAQIETGNSSAVVAFFPTVDTTAEANNLTVATVDFDAVEDVGNNENPIGDAPLGGDRQITTGQAGITAAPDLQNVTNFRTNPNDPAETLVDFVFDEPAFTINTTGFHLVTVNALAGGNQEIVCTATAGAAGGQPGTAEQPSTTITVECPNQPETGSIEASEVARGYDLPNTVSDARPPTMGNENVLQAADVSGTSVTPDLVSAELRPGATASDADVVVYTFDEPVFVASAATPQFSIYTPDGQTDSPDSVSRSGTNDQQVIANFGTGTTLVEQAVGAQVTENAVTEATGGLNRPNEDDEVGVQNQAVTVSAGRTTGPDLTEVRIDTTGTGQRRATYVFDEDVTAPVSNDFFLVDSDGTRLQCASGAAVGTTEDTDNTVSCTNYQVIDPVTGTATQTQIANAVIGTVDDAAIAAEDGGPSNPEGAELTTGGTGTPQQ